MDFTREVGEVERHTGREREEEEAGRAPPQTAEANPSLSFQPQKGKPQGRDHKDC